MMRHHSASPKELFGQLATDTALRHEVAYDCMLCNACSENCPEGIDTKAVFYDVREEAYDMRRQGLPIHKQIGLQKVKNHQSLSFSPLFSSTPSDREAQSIFIPGCSLTNYSPDILDNILTYLKGHMENVTMSVQCCSKPSMYIGHKNASVNQLENLQKMLDGQQIKQIIVACENCYNTYRHHLKNVHVITLWELMADFGIPETLKGHYKNHPPSALHDPCSIRQESHIHDAIRNILTDLGLPFLEFEHKRDQSVCCGSGGMVRETNRHLWEKQRSTRANATNAQHLVSYCQCCVNTLSVSGKNTFHVLDLLFNESFIKGQQTSQKRASRLTLWTNKYISARLSN